MSWKRRLAMGICAVSLGVATQAARAEDPTPPPTPAPAPAPAPPPAPPKDAAPLTPPEAPKKKDPFFGDRFAMYLETRGGPASIDAIDNSIDSGFRSSSQSELNFDGSKEGQFTIGWTLPRGRGQYLLTYTGISDGNLDLNASGSQRSYQNTDGTAGGVILFELPWWNVSVRDGQLTATQTPPVWSINFDVAHGDEPPNNVPDPDEIRYFTPTASFVASVPKSLGNRLQTWDLYYRREFGGVRIRSRWTAGVRYLTFDGALATPAWTSSTSSIAGFGYTDGVQNDLLIMKQSTSGFGPVGSGEIQFNFFRQRLTLYGLLQAAFLLESLDVDSGAFTYFARDTGASSNGIFPGPGRLQDSVSKSTWNTTIELGLRVKILEGFHLSLDWNTTGYLDSILVANDVSIPDNTTQIPLGTTGRFVSRDVVVSSYSLGLSFQF